MCFDIAMVLIFIAIGRSAHHHGITPSGMASTLWPFLVGVFAGSLIVARFQLRPTSLRAGLVVMAATVALGMVLRVISGQGTAFAFILVAIGFLGAAMAAWRIAYSTFPKHRTGASAP